MFLSVVATTSRSGIDLIGDTTVGPFVGVIDLTPLGLEIAARMLAVPDQQQCSLTCRTVEQSLPATLIDDDPSESTTTRRM